MHKEKLEKIEAALRNASSLGRVTVLPDYFVDRFVRLDDFRELATEITMKGIEGGGGSVRGPRQSEVKGGNAVNLAYAMGTLGINVHLITIANSLPAEMLQSVFRSLPSTQVDIIEGTPGFTVAFEFKEANRLVNVMLSDPGDLKKMDGSKLTKEHWKKISDSKILSLVNWASMDFGTEVAEKLFSFAREKKIQTFFDPADILEKEKDLPEFKKRILDKGLIDYFSMNDNEARILSRSISGHKLPQNYSEAELKETIKLIGESSEGTVDIHTHRVSMSVSQGEVTIDHCTKVDQKTVTGAGDVWDASDLLGFLSGLPADVRLSMANAAAGLYVSREDAMPPTPAEILQFIKTRV